jgi:hypothetical protein
MQFALLFSYPGKRAWVQKISILNVSFVQQEAQQQGAQPLACTIADTIG